MQFLKSRYLFWVLMLFSVSIAHGQIKYSEDILGKGFEYITINQPDDYEGKVTCTVVRKVGTEEGNKAVLFVHGFNEYFFNEEMANRYIKEGFTFYALDLRKYGRSYLPHQKFNNVRDLSEYFADVDTALKIIKCEGYDKVLLSGHSTGGLVVSLYADEYKGKGLFDAVFLNSPFFDMNLNGIVEKTVLPLVAKYGKNHPDVLLGGAMSPLYGESLHKEYHGEWMYKLDWKPHLAPVINCGWVSAIYYGHKKVHAGLKIGKPALVMYSSKSIYEKRWSEAMFTGDAILNVEDIAKYARRIKGNCTIKSIDGGLHDLVLSPMPVREKVYNDLFQWLNQNL